MITSPYNFVPLNKQVYIPYWGNLVSHDVPFEDGETGEIDITITAKSPIFIRDSKDDEKFCNYNGEYYIPSSSIKGMIRNVFEILSFSKLREEIFDDRTYAVRDLSSAKNFYMSKMNQLDNTTLCGWLKKVDEKYVIENCDKPGRIHHNQIDLALGLKFSKYFLKSENIFKADNPEQKTAKYKYELVGNKLHSITVSDKYNSTTNPKFDKREFYKFDKNGKKTATLVLTGQPTSRENSGSKGDGKGYEFLFFDVKGEFEVQEELIEKFKFAYFDKRDTNPKESPDWTYWKEKLENGEKIPVFFQLNENQKIEHFGLSYLYKLPYKYSVKDGIDKIHFEDNLDLTQTVFGYINKQKQDALKSRILFSHFKAIENVKELHKRTEILGTPRASYYPNYIKQDRTDNYSTYMNADFNISGRKRYPIHKNGIKKTENTGNDNVGTSFKPLDNGVVFKGKLKYHNLRKVEIGAILSALTFHNTKYCFHNIGMAKSLGYGKISLSVDNFPNIDEYLREFELNISSQIEDWANKKEIIELLTMASDQDNSENSKLEYMKLENFARVKTNFESLGSYSTLNNIKETKLQSKLKVEDKELVDKIFNDNREKLAKIKELEQEKIKLENDWNNTLNSNNKTVYNNFISKYPNELEKIEIINQKLIELEKAEQQQQKEQEEKESNDKWNSILKLDDKLKQKAIEEFIKKYPSSNKINDAKELLNNYLSKDNKSSKVSLDELKNAKDGKRVKSILEKIGEIEINSKNEIFSIIKELIPTLKPKEKSNFFKDAQLGRFIGKELEEELKKAFS
ncbi:TIGR03986 family CRISPR-associated RAMP protein [Aliarcobacter cryaerophilus]|uniref:TIGR03986 family type III CRISPR-associated RAMP protein n=1 Tax=Aliarcobacter cryaerophilus TaxID=28198 RepID=UPI0021B1AE4C|nr:TIGR03986 family CRISPR-associated RAMP protein [Aliarcobacter cryaerophilus]MCT7464792.1 TIGR03986 family CRISPR-associated RAMP protein [Aliarcobacter cryaerophilus]